MMPQAAEHPVHRRCRGEIRAEVAERRSPKFKKEAVQPYFYPISILKELLPR
jgi:hypothetical protein